MKNFVVFLALLVFAATFSVGHALAVSILTTAGSDTLTTFRTNVNTSLTNLSNAFPGTGITVPNGGTGSTTLSGVLVGNGTSAVNTLVLPSSWSISGATIIGALGLTNGGTGTSTSYAGGLIFSDNSKLTQAAGTGNDQLVWDSTNKRVGIGTSSPAAMLSVNPNAISGQAFAIGSSSANLFAVANSGAIALSEQVPATSTSMTLDWANTKPAILYQIGTAATTITLVNATTSLQAGSRKVVTICNPSASAGALTWKGVEWSAGIVPVQTTTTNQCDLYSFIVTQATSTNAWKVFGAQTAGFQ
jgi:hypothetical protein